MVSAQHCTVKFDQRDGYIAAVVECADRPAGRYDQPYLQQIADHCARCKCASILIEKHTPEIFKVWDTVVVAPPLAKIGHAAINIAVAEVGAELPQQKSLDISVGNARSLHIRVFSDVPDAEGWLLRAAGKGPVH